MITPTDHQQDKLNEIYKWIEKDNSAFFILAGSAGTGKSAITELLMHELNLTIALTATTHRAKQVLAAFAGSNVKTIHSHLCLEPKRVKGDTVLKQDSVRYKMRELVDIVIVDESSMISSEILEFIIKDSEKYNTRYIFIGDHKQVLPVNESTSPIFNLIDYSPLTEIVRQAKGSPIIDLATQLRDSINTGNRIDLNVNGSNDIGEVKVLTDAEFLEAIYNNDFMHDDTNDMVIAWTNKRVKYYNKLINESYGIEDKPFEIGAQVMFNEAIVIDGEILVTNGYIAKVSTMDTIMYNGLECLNVTLQGVEGEYRVIPDYLEDEYAEMFDTLKKEAISNPRKWYDFYQVKEQYADIRSIYAGTVHKAQGSTYDTVYVDLKDINRNRDYEERTRLFYTAVTRASKNVYIRV